MLFLLSYKLTSEVVVMARSKWETNVQPKLQLIKNWARDGLIDKQIAKNCEVAYSTFNLYKTKYSELSESLKESKEIADYEVENAMFKAATGYEYYEETLELVDGVMTVTKRVLKHQPPNATLNIFWNKNRNSKKWRDQQHVNHGGGVVSKVVDYSHLSDDELDKELSRYD